MKKYIAYIIFCCTVLTSCKQTTRSYPSEEAKTLSSRENINLEITLLESDSTSIRALQFEDSTYYFAGSKGNYGSYSMKNDSIKKGVILNDTVDLEFRSIAVTENFTYLLNAGAPAFIYKINHDNEEVLKVYQENGEGVFYDSLKFWDDEEGIAMGDPTSQTDKKCISILKTYDGGESWKKIDCTNLPEFIEGEAGFAASNSNISIVGDHVWIATGGKAARVFHSADRGESWVAHKTPIVAGQEMTGIFAMDFYDENRGVIIGGNWSEKDNNNFNKAITTDAGKTWKLMDQGNGPGYCSDILFIPDTDGQELLAVGTPGIWWSGDQGESWKKLSDEGFYTVAMKDRSNGMLMGYSKIASFTLQ